MAIFDGKSHPAPASAQPLAQSNPLTRLITGQKKVATANTGTISGTKKAS